MATRPAPKGCTDLVTGGSDLTDECLRRAAPHVAHDIRTFAESWRRHQKDPFAWIAWFVCCRSLMDFFDAKCSDKRKPKKEGENGKDDICATDFVDPAEWVQAVEVARPMRPGNYDQYRDVVNKLAAHLTYKRIEYADRAQRGEKDCQPSKEVTEYLLGLGALFVRKLTDERAAWFGALVVG